VELLISDFARTRQLKVHEAKITRLEAELRTKEEELWTEVEEAMRAVAHSLDQLVTSDNED
jgi:post-segregation antitoxin (ccd killing protein)